MSQTTQYQTPAVEVQSFESWMKQVDRILERRIGLSSADLEDRCYADYYEDGQTPREVVDDLLEELGDDFE